MNDFVAQIILAARNDDEGTGWMQMLVFVVIAIIYVVGSIAKAKGSKLEERDQEQPGRKPGPRPPEGKRAPKAFQKIPYQRVQRPAHRPPRQQVQPPRRKVTRPQPAVQKFATKTKQDILLETLEVLEAPELSLPRPQLQPKLEEFPEFTRETVKKLEDKRVGIPAERPQAKYVSEPLLDYADPDKLRRAILHYEILGKPLSLRGPSEQIIGL